MSRFALRFNLLCHRPRFQRPPGGGPGRYVFLVPTRLPGIPVPFSKSPDPGGEAPERFFPGPSHGWRDSASRTASSAAARAGLSRSRRICRRIPTYSRSCGPLGSKWLRRECAFLDAPEPDGGCAIQDAKASEIAFSLERRRFARSPWNCQCRSAGRRTVVLTVSPELIKSGYRNSALSALRASARQAFFRRRAAFSVPVSEQKRSQSICFLSKGGAGCKSFVLNSEQRPRCRSEAWRQRPPSTVTVTRPRPLEPLIPVSNPEIAEQRGPYLQ